MFDPWREEQLMRLARDPEQVRAEMQDLRAKGLDPVEIFRAELEEVRETLDGPTYTLMIGGLLVALTLYPLLPVVAIAAGISVAALRFLVMSSIWITQACLWEE